MPPIGAGWWTGSSASTGTSDRVRTPSVESDPGEELLGGEKMRQTQTTFWRVKTTRTARGSGAHSRGTSQMRSLHLSVLGTSSNHTGCESDPLLSDTAVVP
jgi:hypothetical protein